MPSRPPRIERAAAPARPFVDSGAWIALRSRRDQHHTEADRPFREALSRRIIGETHRLTLFRAGVQPALRALERLSPRPITYTDAVSFAVMEANRCGHVLGFDQDFAAAGFTLWRGPGSGS